jgi:subtilisin family serine protease
LPHVFRRALPLALALVLLPAAAARAAAAEVVPGEVVVRFAPDASATARTTALDTVDANDSSATRLPETRLVQLDEDADVHAAAQDLKARPDVVWAEPNYVVRPSRVPNDPDFAKLWGLDNTGQTVEQSTGSGSIAQAGIAGFDTNVLDAWDLTTGSSTVRIGVADSGISHHVDLDANLDTTLSRDFVAGDPFADGNEHGTHVAGTIGAVGDNGIGVTGEMWNADLVSLRVLGASGGTSLSVASAFSYAGELGLPIVNASLGSSASSLAIRDAIRLAPNTLFVVAAGNDDVNVETTPSYPCALPDANIICVASIDNDGARSWYSNYGATSVDLGAPGNMIRSTIPQWDQTVLTTTGSWTHTGTGDDWEFDGTNTWKSDITPNMDATLEATDVIDLGGRAGCSATVTWGGTFGEDDAALLLERQTGGLWERIGLITEAAGEQTDRYDLKADGRSDVRLRVRLVGSPTVAATTAFVRGFSWRCVRAGSSTDYAELSGTSMASPQVAGVAGLLKSAHPELTVAQLREALLSTVTPTPSLAGITVTGGRVNATAALASLTPAPPGPSGGGTTTPTPTPAPTPAPTPDPIPIPVPTLPTATTPATAPHADLHPNTRRLLRRGVLVVRTAVSRNAKVRATATLRWHGGKGKLRGVTRRHLKPGSIATLRLRANRATRRALRQATRDGRRVRVRIVLAVTADGRTRHVVRTLTLR